jgi:perosamine synthetase
MKRLEVPFYRPDIGRSEIEEVTAALRSGWLTTGPRVKHFEQQFAASVGAQHAVALNSCTAALHLAVEALGLGPGRGVLVPTMTFAATAEVVRYLGGIPILVDCDPKTGNMDLADARHRLESVASTRPPGRLAAPPTVVGVMPVHVGGLMLDPSAVAAFAEAHGLWVVEDAAHAFPAAWRPHAGRPWQRCGEATASVTCFSFYANKTITTGEGGMAVTMRPDLADRIRLMSLHGLSHDAWGRYSGSGSWDYRIVAPGYKYNLTDLAAAIGLEQLARAESMRQKRENIARRYLAALETIEEIELPVEDPDRVHAWHLFQIRLNLDRLSVTRDEYVHKLREAGVVCSVHWRPLHLHPYYEELFGYRPEDYPRASEMFRRTVSLPLYPGMTEQDIQHVISAVTKTIQDNAVTRRARTA